MDFDLYGYDKYIVSFSGGKDSTACLLFLLENGVPKERIELWHQEVDGRDRTFFDWEVTPAYCYQLAQAFGIPIYFQWKEGGFLREMLRQNCQTAPTCFELASGEIVKVGGNRGTYSTRLKFPQVSASLIVRWCSGYLKVNVFSSALANQERFLDIKTLVVTGERGEESRQRAQYKIFERHRTDRRNSKDRPRYVDHFRAVKNLTERQIWDMMERHRIRVHPCYYLGFGRCSCKFCIFGNCHQFASAACISPDQMAEIIMYEKKFNYTLKRNTDLSSLLGKGVPFESITPYLIRLATSYEYRESIIVPPEETWILPSGAFSKCCGPY